MTNQSSALREPEREREQDHLRPPTSSPQHLMPGNFLFPFCFFFVQISLSKVVIWFFAHCFDHNLDATTTTTTTTTNSSSKRLRCSPSPPPARHQQQQQQQQHHHQHHHHHPQQQQSPLLQIRRVSPNSERHHHRSSDSPPISLYPPRKIHRDRERDYNSEAGPEDHSQPLQLKRQSHHDDKKHSDYPSSIDDRRSRTPDEDIDDMDDDDDAMSNEHGM